MADGIVRSENKINKPSFFRKPSRRANVWCYDDALVPNRMALIAIGKVTSQLRLGGAKVHIPTVLSRPMINILSCFGRYNKIRVIE